MKRWGIGVLVVATLGVALVFVAPSANNASEATTSHTVDISCHQDIDTIINGDPVGKATRFKLDKSCTHVASEALRPDEGDEVVCEKAPTGTALKPKKLDAFNPNPACDVTTTPGLSRVFSPVGTVYLEGIVIRATNLSYSGTGTGVGLSEGHIDNDSTSYRIVVRDAPAVGIGNAHGIHRQIELFGNGTNPDALGITASGIKGVNEFKIKGSFVHDNTGNGVWCDVYCNDVSSVPFDKFHANHNLIEDNSRAGLRFEESNDTGEDSQANAGEALLENNRIIGNALQDGVTHGNLDIRDAAHALIRDNTFAAGADGIAVRVADSLRSDRPDTEDIQIVGNDLGGDTISGNRDCSQPDTITYCERN